MNKTKIGIFSGTFDPVHMGHVAFALEAKQELKLDSVFFLPELSPRLKQPTSIQHRFKMLELSIEGQAGLSVKLLKIPRYSVKDTLPELQRIFGNTQLVLLLGSDLVRTFKYRWDGLQELFHSVELAIGLRGEDTKAEMVELLKNCARDYGTTITFQVLPTPHAKLASTQIRQGTFTIKDIHPKVALYIEKHNLYIDSVNRS